MEKKKVFITVKTYPTISSKYDELVCTAGFLEDGSWIRLYPLPFRKLEYDNRYTKYQWVELLVERNHSDCRPESYKVMDIDQIALLEKIDSKTSRNYWDRRKEIVFKKETPYEDLAELLKITKDNRRSLAIFKPTEVLDFKSEQVEREWSKEKLDLLKQKASQYSLFQTIEEVKKEFSAVNKLPYKFSFQIRDIKGKVSKMMIEDWEIGMLYWNCLKNGNDEKTAISKVKDKYLGFVQKTDLHLFLGTTKEFHNVAPNPYLIVGLFVPPKQDIDAQMKLF